MGGEHTLLPNWNWSCAGGWFTHLSAHVHVHVKDFKTSCRVMLMEWQQRGRWSVKMPGKWLWSGPKSTWSRIPALVIMLHIIGSFDSCAKRWHHMCENKTVFQCPVDNSQSLDCDWSDKRWNLQRSRYTKKKPSCDNTESLLRRNGIGGGVYDQILSTDCSW